MPSSVIPIGTSYETICAADRIAPKSAHFEPLDQPAIRMPMTTALETASRYRIPMLKLAGDQPGTNGSATQQANEPAKTTYGDSLNSSLSVSFAMMSSLIMSFSASAIQTPKPCH